MENFGETNDEEAVAKKEVDEALEDFVEEEDADNSANDTKDNNDKEASLAVNFDSATKLEHFEAEKYPNNNNLRTKSK